MVLILITYCKISKSDKVFRFSQIVQEKQTRLIFKSWLTNSSSELPEGSIDYCPKESHINRASQFIHK